MKSSHKIRSVTEVMPDVRLATWRSGDAVLVIKDYAVTISRRDASKVIRKAKKDRTLKRL